jgi:serine/threonine protein kinase
MIQPGDTILGKYRIERILGQGGMGVVFAAHHIELGEPFAIKLLRSELLRNENVVARFVREARAAARLRGQHVVRVHDVGRLPSNEPYMIMEYLHGNNLHDTLERHGPLPIAHACRLILQACEGVADAHAEGIVHRDLKLSNLVLTHLRDGRPCLKVLDFGLSKHEQLSEELTHPGMLMGSPAYISPEQVRDARSVDTRTDVWAMGVIAYALITGEFPFAATSLAQLIHQIMTCDAARASTHRHDLPAALDDAIMACLAKLPEQRHPSIMDFARAVAATTPADTGWPATYAASSEPPSRTTPRPATTHTMSSSQPTRAPTDHTPSSPTALTLPMMSSPLELPGGAVSSKSPFYVARPELEQTCLNELTKPGSLVRIKGPRQMGKATLIRRLLDGVAEAGTRAVLIDLQLADKQIMSGLDRLLRWLCAMISRRLSLPRVDGEWDDIFGPKDNCTAYFENHLLGTGQPLVLALANIDRLFGEHEIADEFLTMLRAWHEMAKGPSNWADLHLILGYSTEIYMPLDVNHSPFNVGLAVTLSDWDAPTILALAQAHGLEWGSDEVRELMRLIGGHPHLVRVVLHHLAKTGESLDHVLAMAAHEQGLFADHVKYLLWQLEHQPALAHAAAQVMQARAPIRLSTESAFKLVSLGVVHMRGDLVEPGRELYRRYLETRLSPSPPSP